MGIVVEIETLKQAYVFCSNRVCNQAGNIDTIMIKSNIGSVIVRRYRWPSVRGYATAWKVP